MNWYYDSIANTYDRSHQSGYWLKMNEWELGFVLPLLKINHAILEVGCGSGILLKQVDDYVETAIGIDTSIGMLNIASHKGLNVKCCDAEQLEFANSTFDLVYCFRVLPHFKPDSIKKALAEMARVVKVGGYVVFDCYNKNSIRWLTKKLFPDKIYTKRYNTIELQRMLPTNLMCIRDEAGGVFKSHIVFVCQRIR